MKKKKVSLTMGCYALNEEKLIESFFLKSIADLGRVSDDYEILFIDDGSNDSTLALAKKFAATHPQIKVYKNNVNRGVGYCIKRIFALASKEIVFCNTVDMFFDTNELPVFLDYLEDYDIITGIRTERKSCYNFWRQIISWTNYYLIRFLFNLNLNDYQNVHFYRRKFVQNMFIRSESSFLSPEMLIRASALELKIKQIPIKYHPRAEGKAKGAKIKYLYQSVRDLFCFWFIWVICGQKRKFTNNFLKNK